MARTETERQADLRRARAAKINDARANKSWSPTELARKANLDFRTVRSVLDGELVVSDASIIAVCKALGISPELDDRSRNVEIADAQYGSYAYSSYKNYEGYYFAHRWSFTYLDTIIRSLYRIQWDSSANALSFSENQSYTSLENRPIDHSQAGKVYISPATDLVQLLTITEGELRLLTLRKMRTNHKTMRGAVLTQREGEDNYKPAVSAIYLEKISNFDQDVHLKMIGPVTNKNETYSDIARELNSIEQDVIFVASKNRHSGKSPRVA